MKALKFTLNEYVRVATYVVSQVMYFIADTFRMIKNVVAMIFTYGVLLPLVVLYGLLVAWWAAPLYFMFVVHKVYTTFPEKYKAVRAETDELKLHSMDKEFTWYMQVYGNHRPLVLLSRAVYLRLDALRRSYG